LLRGKLFLKPQDILFIDDEQRQIDGAEKLGIKTMLFQDATQLEADLVVIGVLHKQE
jgi:FMN phosphatase YigB (HAD superfamily)